MSGINNTSHLTNHIERFPSPFDNTVIAQHLRLHGASVQLYADVRDDLWRPLIKAQTKLKALTDRFEHLLRTIEDEISIFREDV